MTTSARIGTGAQQIAAPHRLPVAVQKKLKGCVSFNSSMSRFVFTRPVRWHSKRGARWVTFPLTTFLATLLKNTSALEGAAQKIPIGH